jgi:hypothetical protein
MYKLTPAENNLLLYLECSAVDYGGKIDARRMNDADWQILKTWSEHDFVNYGRIAASDIVGGFSHWAILSEDAWAEAHKERRNRHDRMMQMRKAEFIGYKAY